MVNFEFEQRKKSKGLVYLICFLVGMVIAMFFYIISRIGDNVIKRYNY